VGTGYPEIVVGECDALEIDFGSRLSVAAARRREGDELAQVEASMFRITNRACLRALGTESLDRDALVVTEPQRVGYRGGRRNPLAQAAAVRKHVLGWIELNPDPPRARDHERASRGSIVGMI
jgi:hypothetical protein